MKRLFTFFAAISFSAAAMAQIPNAGFENWTSTNGYENPDGWSSLNQFTSIAGVTTCIKSSPGAPGSYFLNLTSKTIPNLGVAPGIAVCGTLNSTTYMPQSGFAFSQRPQVLYGNWQYMASGSDYGFVAVLLTKWNTATSNRDTIAFTLHNLSGMEMSWTPFSITLDYQHGDNPDTALIAFSASQLRSAANGSYLFVDSIGFAGNVPNGVQTVKASNSKMSIYPNPATDNLTIVCSDMPAANVRLQLIDMMGRVVSDIDGGHVNGAYKYNLNVSGFAKGLYMLKVSGSGSALVERVVIQ